MKFVTFFIIIINILDANPFSPLTKTICHFKIISNKYIWPNKIKINVAISSNIIIKSNQFNDFF
jgi:hypothetical protein